MANKPKNKWSYFYYDDKLYHTIAVKRALNELYAERVKDKERKFFAYSDVIRHAKRCWTISEVSKVVGVNNLTINKYYRQGYLTLPECTNFGKNQHRYLLSEKHIGELVQFCSEHRLGSPGVGRPRSVITKTLSEVMLELEEGLVLYTRSNNGDFVPVWRAEEW